MSAAPGPVLPDLKRPARGKPGARLVSVAASHRITPNMIRLTLTGPDLADVRIGCEGANCKILLPEAGQTREGFAQQIKQGPRPVTRTYTVRHWRPEVLELDVDFVDHGNEGPASAFANRAVPGDFCGFAGPGPVKLAGLTADWYLVAADMSALPVAAATLEAMPRDARGVAICEVTDPADRQQIDAPEGIVQHWLPHPDPHRPSQAQETLIRALDWPEGPNVRVQTCIAGESTVIKSLRAYLHQDRALPRKDTYISGYLEDRAGRGGASGREAPRQRLK